MKEMKDEPSVLRQRILTFGCHVFAIHSRQCSAVFSHFPDSVFLQGCNSITSFVLRQLASSLHCFPEMYRQGVLGQLKFTCSNSNQIPRECTCCCIRPLFQRNILCFHEAFKAESILFVFWKAVHVGADEDFNSAANGRYVSVCGY